MRKLLGATFTLAAALALPAAALATGNDASDQVVNQAPVTKTPDDSETSALQPDGSRPGEIRPASEAPVSSEQPAQQVQPAVEDPFTTALKAALAETPKNASARERAERTALAAFYEARSYQPLWTTATGLSERATAAIEEIRRADEWGLDRSDFELPTLPPDPGKEQLATTEMSLGLTVLKYARFAQGGRLDPRALTKYLDRTPPLSEPATVLSEIAQAEHADAYLRGLHPQHPQFERLRQKYLELRKSQPDPAQITKVPFGPQLTLGTRHPHVALVRERLGVSFTGDPADETLYDEELVQAVKDFQTKRGLSPDGVVGSATRSAFNNVETGGARRLLANMEQWRWMPRSLGDYYVWVNIPDFMIRVVQNGKVIHAERIVVGKVDSQTPIFSDELEQVIFHPFWGVPDSIKRLELQPNMAAGGSILARQGLRVQYRGRDVDPDSIDWQAMDMRNVHIYQPPGPSNVLGVVKFRFPNQHDVYFHDTPQKHLFSANVRTFSHGCMRVQNPVRLAELILAHDKNMSSERVRSLSSPGAPKDNQINLTSHIPVHITYFTASVEDDGKVAYRKDFYGHEERISLGLEGKMNLISRVREPSAPQRPVVSDNGNPFKSSGTPRWLRNIFNF